MKKKKFFHDTYFKKIVRMAEEKRLEQAIQEYEKYIINYPNDLDGYSYCADAYIKLGDFDKAESILKRAIITDRTSEEAKEQFIMFKIKLLCCQGKYRECLNVLVTNKKVFKKNDWSYFGTLLYLKKQLGILEENDYKIAEGTYLFNQLINYDEEEAILHIQKHLYFDGNNNSSIFVENFPLREVYFKLRELLLLNNKNKIYDSMIGNEYVFKYAANGHVGTKLVDYFIVVTIKDTNEIITMCPYENKEKRPCIDLTPIEKEETKPKVKRLSQIDKFNQRYSKN